MLAARLKYLEEEGLVYRRTLPPPAASTVYDLTDAGQELEPVIMAIARWGLKWTLGEPEPDDVFRPAWAVLAMQASYDADADAAAGVKETYEFRIGEEIFYASVDDGDLQACHGPAHAPDLVIEADEHAFFDIAAGRTTIAKSARDRRIAFKGDRAMLKRCSAILDRSSAASQARVPAAK